VRVLKLLRELTMKIKEILTLSIMIFFIGCSESGSATDDESSLSDLDVEVSDTKDAEVNEDLTDEISDEIIDEESDETEVLLDEDLSDTEGEDLDETVDEDVVKPLPHGCLQGDFNLYYGNFHSHTGNSDGKDDPETAFIYARDTAGIDILAVTDHLEQLYTYYGLPDDDHPDCIKTAKEISDSDFLAVCGYEYGSGFEVSLETGLDISTGHSNVFFNEKLLPVVQLDFRDYYASVQNCFECVTQINHPGDEATQTFNEFEPHPEIFDKMALYEFNGGGDVWNLMFMALSKGWYISPTYNQDNHSANWGDANDNRTGIFMTSLTNESLKEAFLKRRTFATSDKNAVIKMMADDVCWMGSQLSGVDNVKISITVSDPDMEGFDRIELFDAFQNVIATADCEDKPTCELNYDLAITAPIHVVAKAVQSDDQFLVASPLWIMP